MWTVQKHRYLMFTMGALQKIHLYISKIYLTSSHKDKSVS